MASGAAMPSGTIAKYDPAIFGSMLSIERFLGFLLAETESARTELRFIHLSQPYKTVQFLSREQIARYKVLRGYADDPCANVPEGHNP